MLKAPVAVSVFYFELYESHGMYMWNKLKPHDKDHIQVDYCIGEKIVERHIIELKTPEPIHIKNFDKMDKKEQDAVLRMSLLAYEQANNAKVIRE